MTPLDKISYQIDKYHDNLSKNADLQVKLGSGNKPSRAKSLMRFGRKHDINTIFNSLSNKLRQEDVNKISEKTRVYEPDSPSLKVPKTANSYNIMSKGLYQLEKSPSKNSEGENLITHLISDATPTTKQDLTPTNMAAKCVIKKEVSSEKVKTQEFTRPIGKSKT
jgi:hypothetical protein